MKKLFSFVLLFWSMATFGQAVQNLPNAQVPVGLTGKYTLMFYETFPGSGVWMPSMEKVKFTDILNNYALKVQVNTKVDSLKLSNDTLYTYAAGVRSFAAKLPAGGGGNVASVFGRTGTVAAQASDYAAFYPSIQRMLDSIAAVNGRIAAGGLTVDATPTDGSNNPVASNGVFDAIAPKANTSDVNAALTNKVDKVAGKGLSEKNYTAVDSLKLATAVKYSFSGLLHGDVLKYDSVNNLWINTRPRADSILIEGGGYAAIRARASDSSITFVIAGNSYTIKANGVSSGSGNGGSSGPAYLTWAVTGSDMEAYNASQGMRKKASGSAAWETPSLAASSVRSAQTLSNGESVIVKVSSNPALATAIVLSSSTAPSMNNVGIGGNLVSYAWYSGAGLSANAQPLDNEGNNLGSTTAITAGNLLKITYGTSITFYKSTDGGSNWTLISTSPDAPSGTYNIIVQSYSPLGG
ncbi:MAG: hypothetical protein EOP49_05065, partial [Sphingobacteriales bacterium]